MIPERLKETLAMLMIGDGVLAVIDPDRHARLWWQGPAYWRRMVEPFVQRPGLTRWAGAAEVAVGLWLASRQAPDREALETVPRKPVARARESWLGSAP